MSQPIWNTASGLLRSLPSGSTIVPVQLNAVPVAPATTVTYSILSGALPPLLQMTTAGLIYGSTQLVNENTSYTFVVRATDNLGNIYDRTFSMFLSGIDAPSFTTPSGSILYTEDSQWIELQIQYTNPIPTDTVIVRLIQGQLPPGLEINEYGLIRGYPKPPLFNTNTGLITTDAIETINNTIICYNTAGFVVNRPIVFSENTIGGIIAGTTYYVQSVIDEKTFTISTTTDGPILALTNEVGFMPITLPDISIGQPTIRTYTFTLKLESQFGSSISSYSITVVNQNLKPSPGKPDKSRTPAILNTRPLSYAIRTDDINYSYYSLPADSKGTTYPLTTPAYIGKFTSDNLFSFKILGYDFDGSELEYVYQDLPLGLTGDPASGWVTGTPTIADNSVSQYDFSVAVRKKTPVYVPPLPEPPVYITSPFTTFTFKLINGITGDVNWISPENLGVILNNTDSVVKVQAVSELELNYELVSGTLPPNLTLAPSGELIGTVAFQPTAGILNQGEMTEFNFTIKAFSPSYPVANNTKSFTLTVLQKFASPMDTLYIKCTPSIEDRNIINSLLTNSSLIPDEYLYRADDPNFGKATNVVYEHAYGINASNFDEYIAAVTKNHYWRNITLGELRTAVARDQNTGEIVYEVVYSYVYDNLVNYQVEDKFSPAEQTNIITPQGQSISKEIYWPRPIVLPTDPPIIARILYPNSLPNMRQQVVDVLGQEQNTDIFPLWMTSQQADGSTTGFVPAWVICYTKPGYSEIIKNNIKNNWKNPAGLPLVLNQINFKIDRFSVSKITSYDYDKNLNPPAWIGLPSATPTPDPTDSKDFYVWFPRQTILPDETQY